jgi:hypothetical protein
LIVTCGRDKHICVIDLNRGVVIRRFTSYHGLPTAVGLTDKTPEEVFVATNSIIVYKLTSAKFLQELLRPKLPVVSLAATSITTGTVLASAAKNAGQITTWYLPRVKRNESEKFPSAMLKMNTPPSHLAVQAKADETVLVLAVSVDGKAFVWRLCMKKCFFVWIVVKLVLQHQCALFQNRNIIMAKLLQESSVIIAIGPDKQPIFRLINLPICDGYVQNPLRKLCFSKKQPKPKRKNMKNQHFSVNSYSNNDDFNKRNQMSFRGIKDVISSQNLKTLKTTSHTINVFKSKYGSRLKTKLEHTISENLIYTMSQILNSTRLARLKPILFITNKFMIERLCQVILPEKAQHLFKIIARNMCSNHTRDIRLASWLHYLLLYHGGYFATIPDTFFSPFRVTGFLSSSQPKSS